MPGWNTLLELFGQSRCSMEFSKRKLFFLIIGFSGVILIVLANFVGYSTERVYVVAANFHNSSLSYLTAFTMNISFLSNKSAFKSEMKNLNSSWIVTRVNNNSNHNSTSISSVSHNKSRASVKNSETSEIHSSNTVTDTNYYMRDRFKDDDIISTRDIKFRDLDKHLLNDRIDRNNNALEFKTGNISDTHALEFDSDSVERYYTDNGTSELTNISTSMVSDQSTDRDANLSEQNIKYEKDFTKTHEKSATPKMEYINSANEVKLDQGKDLTFQRRNQEVRDSIAGNSHNVADMAIEYKPENSEAMKPLATRTEFENTHNHKTALHNTEKAQPKSDIKEFPKHLRFQKDHFKKQFAESADVKLNSGLKGSKTVIGVNSETNKKITTLRTALKASNNRADTRYSEHINDDRNAPMKTHTDNKGVIGQNKDPERSLISKYITINNKSDERVPDQNSNTEIVHSGEENVHGIHGNVVHNDGHVNQITVDKDDGVVDVRNNGAENGFVEEQKVLTGNDQKPNSNVVNSLAREEHIHTRTDSVDQQNPQEINEPADDAVGFVRDPKCRSRPTLTEDLLCLKRPKFLSDYKNPCWYEGSLLRCLPYFYIIGVCKTGSTDLFERLSHHPQVLKNNGVLGKETWYWSWGRYGHSNFYRSYRDVMSFDEFIDKFEAYNIQGVTKRQPNGTIYHPAVTGHGDPMDFWDHSSWPQIPQNDPSWSEPNISTPSLVKHVNPNIKLILLLRDPVERLFSNYLHGKFGDTAEQFHEDVLRSLSLLSSCRENRSLKSCLYDSNIIRDLSVPISGSFYSIHLEEWLKVFPRKQLFIIRTEEFSTNVAKTLLRIFRFLRLDPIPTRDLYRIANMPHFYDTKAKQTAGEILPETREILKTLFEPYNTDLVKILNDERFRKSEMGTAL